MPRDDAPRQASLTVADACLEAIGDVSTHEEGAQYATVAMGHALTVLARSVDHQNHLLASLARTLEKTEGSLAFLVRAATLGDHPEVTEEYLEAMAARIRR